MITEHEMRHMRIWERTIMMRFIEKKILVGKYDFDIHVRVAEPIYPTPLPDNFKYMWEKLTNKRIDAICETEDTIWIIEVKDRLRPSGIGQLLTYKILYTTKYMPAKKVELAYVSAVDDTDIRHICDAYNIHVFIV